ncbi:MAG: YybH family protein [Planctomycetota bacterium]
MSRSAVAGLGGVVLAAVAGCSATHDGAISGVAVEPELRRPAVARSVRPAAPGLVPVVIAPPRPGLAANAAPRKPPVPHRLPGTEPGAVRSIPEAVSGVRGLLASYAAAFNRHDVAELAAHWSASGENIDLASGEVTRGREAVRNVFASLFTDDAAAVIDIDVASIHAVRADVAVVDGTSRVSFADGSAAASRFSAVAVQQAGRWVLESVRENPLPTSFAPPQPLEQLGWLVGMWEDVGPGLTAATTCDWSPGRAFLVRIHSVRGDGTFAERTGDVPGLLPAATVDDRQVTEIIGWDPERETIRSWMFTSAGRFAEGTWLRHGDEWTVQIEGRGADSGRSCGFVVGRDGDDTQRIRGSDEGLAAALVPVCDFVRTAH